MVRTVRSCCVIGCKNVNLGDDSGVSFFKFPEVKSVKKKWIEAIRNHIQRKDWDPESNGLLCNVHFVSGQHSPHEWHPDYVPSVFRSLRTVKPRAKGRYLDDYVDDTKKKPKTPTVKRLQGTSTVKRASLSTPTRLTQKSRTGHLAMRKSLGSYFNKSGGGRSIQSPLLKIVDVRTEKGVFPDLDEEIKSPTPDVREEGPPKRKPGRSKNEMEVENSNVIQESQTKRKPGRPAKVQSNSKAEVATPSPETKLKPKPGRPKMQPVTKAEDPASSPEAKPKSGKQKIRKTEAVSSPEVKIKPGPASSKKHKLSEEFEQNDTPVLKKLSVVLERTSVNKMKITNTGDITIKEEPTSELEEPEQYFEYPIPNTFVQEEPCKKCPTLEQKIKKMELDQKKMKSMEAKKVTGGTCRRCPVLEHKLKRAETEIDTMLEAKLNKCQKCTALEQKNKKLDNNVRKAQAEVSRLQAKLSSIEITEESFKKYKQKVKFYTGLPNHETLMIVFDHVKDLFPDVGIKSLTPYQMFVIVLMRIKLNLPFWDLTYRFGTSPNMIQSFYPQYVSVLECQLSHVVLWPKTNMHYRLHVLVSNLKQSFEIIKDTVEVGTLLIPNTGKMTEEEKLTRVCAAIYHISQLVSSNHNQQLLKILKSKDDTDRDLILKEGKSLNAEMTVENGKESEKAPEITRKEITDENRDHNMVNGNEDVDDSDIFFEDFTKDLNVVGLNSKDSLQLECKNIRKEMDHLTQRLTNQFRFYTGMRTYEVFNNLLSFLSSFVSNISEERLNHFQQLHLVLIRLKLNLEVQDLSYLFSVDPDHIVYLTRLWIDVMAQKLSRYIDWPAGIEDADGEKRLLGSVKLKYQALWGPHLAPRNKVTGRDREKINLSTLLRACAALYNIDDIEVFKDGKKESKSIASEVDDDTEKSNEELERECLDLRTQLFDLRKCNMNAIANFFSEESFLKDDQMVKFYTGFPNNEALMNVFTLIVPASKSDPRKLLSPFQQFLIIMLRLKLNLATADIGLRFGISQSNTHKLMQDWLILLHSQVAAHITWPDDEDDVDTFTEILRKTYAHLRTGISPSNKDKKSKGDNAVFDIATLVCAGLYNVGEVTCVEQSDSEFDSFDDDW